MFQRAFSFPIILCFLLVLGCFNFPTQFQGQYALDCSKATIPNNLPSGTTGILGYVEIYDFNKQLLVYTALKPNFQNSSLNYVWDGKDMAGNSVGPGKYISKISIIDLKSGRNQCVCTDLYISPK